MILSLRPTHLRQYKDIAWLLWKYGRSDLVKRAGLEDYIPDADTTLHQSAEEHATAHELVDDLEKMGPTYIKLGQLLSTRPDVLPKPYVDALTRLQDKVEPFDFGEVEKILAAELGVRLARAFQSINPKPMAAASLGQVHQAVLRDGRHVAIKVQRPGIRECMIEDFEVLTEVAGFLDAHTDAGRRSNFTAVIEEFRKMLMRELDYRQEAQNLITLGRNLAGFTRIVVPQPIEDYCTGRVLTMQYISGQKITALSPIARLETDGYVLAEEIFRAYLQQILVDGFFHADPHPGNVFLTEDNKIALLDLGMVARLAPEMQEHLLQLVLAIADGTSNDAVAFALRHGEKLEDFNEKELQRRVADIIARQRDLPVKSMQIGTTMLEIRAIALDCGVRLPSELTLIGKTLLNLDQIGTCLAPDFDPNASIRRHSTALLRDRFLKSFTTGNLFSRAIDMKDFVQNLPGRFNRILDAIAGNELKVQVDAIDEPYLMTGMQKVANRITLGLILAALIIGAALLMRVETSFRLFGYPGFAIIFFLLAATAGCVLMFHILFHDETSGRKGS